MSSDLANYLTIKRLTEEVEQLRRNAVSVDELRQQLTTALKVKSKYKRLYEKAAGKTPKVSPAADIFNLIEQGYRVCEIAAKLNVNRRTVSTYKRQYMLALRQTDSR